MPRGRGRPKKPRLSRLDAAVDAMLPLGFPEGRVKKHVKELLEVYGGDDAWPFIEDTSYKVLLESLLEEKDDQENVVENGNQTEEKPCGNEEAGCSSSRASKGEKDIATPDIVEPPAAIAETTTTPPPIPSPSPAGNRPKRAPCYGWVSSDDDDNEFIYLKPAVESMAVQVRAVSTWTRKPRSRSRWDVKPGDW